VSEARELRALELAEALPAATGHADFFVYSDDERTRIAVGVESRLELQRDAFLLTESASTERISCTDPYAQLSTLFERFARGRSAFGFLAFELATWTRESAASADVPFLSFIVPAVEVELVGESGELREVRGIDRATVEQHLVGARRRELEAPVAIDVHAGLEPYEKVVRGALEIVRKNGDLEKVIVSRRVAFPGSLDTLASYRLALRNTAARRFAFRLGRIRGAGTPPGIVFRSSADGWLEVNPLAGTKPRGQDDAADRALRRELLRDPKEVAEHAMVVRLAQEQLAEVCEPGSVAVSSFMAVKLFPFTQHITSIVGGRRSAQRSIWDAVRATFPATTVTGVPKAEALATISNLEAGPRGVYGGAIGAIDGDGRTDLAIALRSVFENDGTISLGAGAGIVPDSSVEDELEESTNKLRTMARCVCAARS